MCEWGTASDGNPAVVVHALDFRKGNGATQHQALCARCAKLSEGCARCSEAVDAYDLVVLPVDGVGSEQYIIGEIIGLAFAAVCQ